MNQHFSHSGCWSLAVGLPAPKFNPRLRTRGVNSADVHWACTRKRCVQTPVRLPQWKPLWGTRPRGSWAQVSSGVFSRWLQGLPLWLSGPLAGLILG